MSAGASYFGHVEGGYFVTQTLDGCHALHPDYPLLDGDLLVKHDDGTYAKVAPGLGIFGFRLTPEQEATLRPNDQRVGIEIGGMDWLAGSEA